jgi:hypothetical protein
VSRVGARFVLAATIAPPWAVDAAHRAVRTSYRLEGRTLVQTVQHAGARYPVVADPQVSWGIITGTAYFTKAETTAIAAGGNAGIVLLTGVPGLGMAMAFHLAVIEGVAVYALAQGKCLKIKVPTFEPSTVRPGTRNCRS